MNNLTKVFLSFLSFILNFPLFAQDVKYNKHYSIACHNCYEPQYATNIEDVFPYTTAIEIDIWDNEKFSGIAGSNKMDFDWYVKHEPNQKGNLNCCGGTLKDCLSRINKWSDNNTMHNVITLFLDKKENWSEADEHRKPADLDKLILSIFPKDKIFAPSNLLQSKGNLKASVSENWPTLDSLKGMFIFVITDGTTQLDIPIISPHRTPLNEYLDAEKNSAICFVAPKIGNENEIKFPAGFSELNAQNVVFYNLEYPSNHLGEKINSINCLTRIYNSPETAEDLKNRTDEKINFIAFHNFKIK
jgi:hypothetical protein